MMTVRKSNERGHADHGWLNARHTFSFADYMDPQWMGFRSLRVINDDRVSAGNGFGMHGHRDMEIITYILSGQLEHRDSMGNGRVIQPGEFQYMSAGSGVRHSEFNPSETEGTHLLQIWIQPGKPGGAPRYAERPASKSTGKGLQLIASGDGRDGSFGIRQDADLFLARLEVGDKAGHTFAAGRHGWIHVAEGNVVLNGQSLEEGDSAAFENETTVALEGVTPAQVLLFDLK